MENSAFKCSKHNLNYIKYCNNCEKNICSNCEEEHKNHPILFFDGYISKVDLKKKFENFERCIVSYKEYINNQVSKLEKLKQKIDEYHKVIEEHVKNYTNKNLNYEMLQTLNKFFGFNIINYINQICNSNNNIVLSEELCDKLGEKLYENYNETQINKNNIPAQKPIQFKNPVIKFNSILFNYSSQYHRYLDYDIFQCIKDDKLYFVTNDNNLLVVYLLGENKKLKTLEGHKYDVNLIKYYCDEKNNKEYLMSKDDDRDVIIWDISKNFNIYSKQRVLLYASTYTCILFFPLHLEQNYFISSLSSQGTEDLKVYKLENKNPIESFPTASKYGVNHLLPWYNNSDKKYYIVKFLVEEIRINDLFEGQLYVRFSEQNRNYTPGFIQTKNNVDYLYAFSNKDWLFSIWDLTNKICFKKITYSFSCRKVIKGNSNFCLLLTTQSIKVLDLNNFYFVQTFKKKLLLDTKENNIFKLSNNNGEEFLISVEKVCDSQIKIKLFDY